MSDPAPTTEQLRESARRHRELAKRHPEKAATHNDIADALEREADTIEAENDFAVRQQRVGRLKVLIAEHEAAGRTADARRTRELLAEATESIGRARMGRTRWGED